ncbi:hypothetical protein [Coxiella-like endosymbiont]|uniref:hypothetical protein n=1 Tax=Coxiella-like endosymbiont TaxID=1592897 RepID=UPI00272B08E8|nr:hypothetical protein [Coxiella-like endosymbiont]
MRQKKNPYGLVYFKGLKDIIIASIMKGCSGKPDNRIFAYGESPRSIDLIIEGIDLVTKIISQLDVKK